MHFSKLTFFVASLFALNAATAPVTDGYKNSYAPATLGKRDPMLNAVDVGTDHMKSMTADAMASKMKRDPMLNAIDIGTDHMKSMAADEKASEKRAVNARHVQVGAHSTAEEAVEKRDPMLNAIDIGADHTKSMAADKMA
ncbi:hypothetical protein MMC13_003156 [Lambiella insularis]|nr:hypothetical protein [Lambiella insularis]